MPRIQFSDVTPPERRSIRDIPIPNGGKRKVPIIIKPEKEPAPKADPYVSNPKIPEITEKEKKDSGAYEYYYPKIKKEPKQNSRKSEYSGSHGRNKQWIFGTVIVILVVVFIVSMMTVFASATIDIKPKSEDVDVSMKITGTTEKAVSAVRYEIIKLSESKTISVPATGEEATELKASGKIVIYNDFSAEPQRLITRTRFETPAGLIYRISESVVVPGKTIKNGADTPGSIEVTVFADEAGEKYNIKKSDFTIPGFKNDADRYKNFYARSTTDMTGGFIGKVKTVSPESKQTALQNVESEAQAELQKNLESKIPDGLTLIPGSILYKSEELIPKDESSSVALGKEVTAYAVMLNKQDLSDQIINEYVASSSDWMNIKSIIKDFSTLKIVNALDNLETSEKLSLQINGQVKVLADIDANVVRQKLLGAPKGKAAELMDEFAGISSITATLRPVWKQSFPGNSSKIYIRIIDN